MTKSAATRAKILAAATKRFSDKSFDAVSVRSIARNAGVDQSLIHHYFGSKEELFDAVLGATINPDAFDLELSPDDSDSWGAELVRAGERAWTSAAGPAMIALVRHSIGGNSALLRTFITTRLITRLATHARGDEAERRVRASAVGSQMVGLMIARHVVRIEPLASLEVEDVVRLYGPTIQRYLTGEIEGLG